MIVLKLLFLAWDLYTLALLVNFLVPFFTKKEQPWIKLLAQICEPAVNVGKIVTKKIFGDKEFSFDMGALMAVIVCIVIGVVASAIVF
ncbi:MAG: hypothetical protein IJN44_08285 [Clostridia bacterium]|nr:hypothetical protein [Clostridia bacterium]